MTIQANILIVDDRPENLLALEEFLKPHGAQVLKAHSGTEALELLLVHKVALALVDVEMPEMDGYELASLMRGAERTREIPIIFLTAGSADYSRVFKGYDVGAVDFLIKPFEPQFLDNKIRTFLRLHRQARELAEARTHLQAVMDAAPVGITFCHDPGCGMVTGNRTAREQLRVSEMDNLSPQALYSGARKICFSLDGRELSPEELPLRRAVVEGREVGPLELAVASSDGLSFWAEIFAAPVRDENANVIGGVAITLDVTERVHAEKLRQENETRLARALKDSEEAILARDQVVSLVSHDLRNPLGVLQTQLAIMRKALEGDTSSISAERANGYLSRMERQVRKMGKLLDELLDVAKLQAGQPLTLEPRPTDLVALARELAEEHQRSAQGHRIELCAPAPSLMGNWDPDRLERVIDNLLSNAVKYSAKGSEVLVEVEGLGVDGSFWAVLRVCDQGVGIPEKDRERVFEWFARGRNVEHKIQGTGLGLAGARHIVEQHGGSISVESQEGLGSIFIVRLPLS